MVRSQIAPAKTTRLADSWPSTPAIDRVRYTVVEDDAPWAGFDPDHIAFLEAAPSGPEKVAPSGRFGRPASLAHAPVEALEEREQVAALAELAAIPAANRGPRMGFAAWLELQAVAYRSHGTSAADWLARQIDALVSDALFFGATSGASFDDRRATHDQWLREQPH
jgi:hypothetical protein